MSNTKKKVAIIGPAFPLRGGLASFNERLALAYQEQGHQVKIYTFSLQYPSIFFPGKTQMSEDAAPDKLNIEVCINSVNPFNWIKVGKRIAKQNYDLIITRFWIPFMGPSLGTILRQVKDRKHTKVVGLIDNIIPHEARVGDRSFAQYFVNTVDAFIVMSKAVGEQMTTFVKEQRIAYTPHPIYDIYGQSVDMYSAKAHLSLPQADNYLLFFGFIRAYKGLDLLLEAMAQPAVKALNLKLLIAGEFYDDQEKYEDQIKSLQIEKNVIMHTSYISNEQVRYYFSAADLIVQPYRTATQSGISQIAYHFEKPMLVTRVGGLPEIVDHNRNGYVVPLDPKIIAMSIVDFYNMNRADDFRRAVIKKKKEFSWSNFMNAIDNL